MTMARRSLQSSPELLVINQECFLVAAAMFCRGLIDYALACDQAGGVQVVSEPMRLRD